MSDKQQEATTYLFATIGARTPCGGRVSRTTSGVYVQGHALAYMGDTDRGPNHA
jgi:hypothetical protein